MRSSELARLAGVTVRTLRHYHQIGLLAEPSRTSGDYRDYDVHDLVRVLRIKRLAALGLPLQRLPAVLDGEAHDTDSVLDELDRELAAEVARLAAQREVIAVLRRESAAPDLPPEFARHARLFDAGRQSTMSRFDREQLILLAQLAGDEGLGDLARFYDRFTDPATIELLTRTSSRFDALDEHTDPDEVERFIDETATAMAPLVTALDEGDALLELGDGARLLGDHSAEVLNPVQRRALQALEARFAAASG